MLTSVFINENSVNTGVLFTEALKSVTISGMVDESVREITTFLNESEALGNVERARLQQLVYNDLKRIAANRLSHESSNNTLSATALVHEAFLRLDSTHSMKWKSRRHYFGAAAESMRRILIDKARYAMRQRREGAKNAVSLDEGLIVAGVTPSELVQLDDGLTDLEQFDNELADILKLKYFVGLSAYEIGELYDTPTRTMTRKIAAGRAWLSTHLETP